MARPRAGEKACLYSNSEVDNVAEAVVNFQRVLAIGGTVGAFLGQIATARWQL